MQPASSPPPVASSWCAEHENSDTTIASRCLIWPAAAYGPFLTKLLARWIGGPGIGSTGYWVQRNADNLAYYALAKYVTSKNGNIYPHLPIVTSEIAGPPYPHHLNVIDEFITDGSNLSINTTDDVQNIYQAWTNFINVDYSSYGWRNSWFYDKLRGSNSYVIQPYEISIKLSNIVIKN